MLERARVYIVRTQFLIFRKFRGNGRFTHTDTHHVTRCVLIICRRAQARTGGGAQGDRIEPKLLFFAMGLNKSYVCTCVCVSDSLQLYSYHFTHGTCFGCQEVVGVVYTHSRDGSSLRFLQATRPRCKDCAWGHGLGRLILCSWIFEAVGHESVCVQEKTFDHTYVLDMYSDQELVGRSCVQATV